jgi:hypothetical protein
MSRILSLNEHYIKHIDEKELFEFLKIFAKSLIKRLIVRKKNTDKIYELLKNKQKLWLIYIKMLNIFLVIPINISSEDSKLLGFCF